MITINEFDYIVIGSGIAGLSAALKLSEHHTVAILTKNSITESATNYAQGGIAVSMAKEDTPLYHFNDTIKAGAGLCNEEAVKILVQDGPKEVKKLIQLGANFDKEGSNFEFTKEAAHSKRRILHAKDATGKEIEKTLGNTLLSKKNVTFFQNMFLLELLVNENKCNGCIAVQKNTLHTFIGKSLILTSGGCGQVFSHTTNPPVATGDGIALAHTAGAKIKDMEFIQFHPTTLTLGDKKPISIFLISEAVRGEGALLRNINGERFMPHYSKEAELAPRDVVSRAVYQEMQKTKNHVFLDLQSIKTDIKIRFPTIYKRCLDSGIDITKDFIPVSPAAHYCMGGIKTTIWGETTITNLFAAGEVSSLGLHGANRLASNSLLEGLVFGNRAAVKAIEISTKKNNIRPSQTNFTELTNEEKLKSLSIKQEIKSLMWRKVSIIRCEKELQSALKKLNSFQWLETINPIDESVKETQTIWQVAKLITKAAIDRKESRGAHFRSDYPPSK